MREANDRGYRCVVLADCCASYFPEFHDMGLTMIKAQGGDLRLGLGFGIAVAAITPSRTLQLASR